MQDSRQTDQFLASRKSKLKREVSPKDFYLRNNKGHLKLTKLKQFLINVDSARRERAGWKIPPASGTNQIAGFVEFRPLTH